MSMGKRLVSNTANALKLSPNVNYSQPRYPYDLIWLNKLMVCLSVPCLTVVVGVPILSPCTSSYVSTSANEKAGQSRRKSLKSGSYDFPPHHQGAQHVLHYIVKTVHGFCQIVYDKLGYLYPGSLCGPD